MTLTILMLIIWANLATGQNFLNGDLNGIIGVSSLPANWQFVPFTDVNCQATWISGATPDVTGLLGPDSASGLNGNPYSGQTFVSGLHAGDNTLMYQEGIMQNVSGFIINHTYSISFYQSVVKQTFCLDVSGSWAVYIDTNLIGITPPTHSSAAFNSTSFIWELENITFTATSTSHLIKFLPLDDDANHDFSATDSTGGLRMGIDYISLISATGINNNYNSKPTYIFPNPVRDQCFIQFDNSNKEICTLILYNLQGQIMRTINNITSDQVVFQKNDLTRDLYYFVLRTDNRVIVTGKLSVE
jgi:hypothetical protein